MGRVGLACAVVAALAVAGCGGSSKSSQPTTAPTVSLWVSGTAKDYRQVAALSVHVGHSHESDYLKVKALAAEAGREAMLERVLTDVQLSGHRSMVFSPSHLQRHLLGVRALELAAAYYVLVGADADMDEAFGLRLLEPMRAYLFPDAPRV